MLDRTAQTLFRCATEQAPQALELWRDFAQKTAFEELTDPQRRLLPAVWKNLSSEQEEFPGCHQLRSLYRYTWAKNLRQQKGCEQVIRLLQEADIPTIVLKGIVLNLTVYDDLGTRPAHDFDLLVPFSHARSALDCLYKDGWQVLNPEELMEPELRLSQAVALVKNNLEFDLHWFALREARNPRQDEPLWAYATPFKLGSVETKMLARDHQFMHLLVNGTREPENCYRFLLDLKLFLQKYESEIDFTKVRELLAKRYLLHRLSYLPLGEIGCEALSQGSKGGLLDRCWSWCSRYVNDGSGEMIFGVFPFLDYWLHYARRQEQTLTWSEYCRHQFKIEGWADFLNRLWLKLVRTFRR